MKSTKINKMPITSISLTDELLEKLDEYLSSRGYSSRSEAIRDAVRDALSEYELMKRMKGKVMATITMTYGYGKRSVEDRLSRLRHEFDDVITGNTHIHIAKRHCLEVFVAEGMDARVFDLLDRIRTIKGIEHVKHTVTLGE